jgi:hypothetical protein
MEFARDDVKHARGATGSQSHPRSNGAIAAAAAPHFREVVLLASPKATRQTAPGHGMP